ncbi:MAG TPA: hypothetical protein VJV03_18745 [Pyrinomonadaceae bacterium]|nr:hypothetical protein [Pyrinomonadaceae bacterium]
MKRRIFMLAVSVAVTTMAVFATAQAQTTQQSMADIPFDFHVGSERFAAGQYTVRCLNPSSDVKVLQLRSKDGKTTVSLLTNSVVGQKDKKSSLVFNRYGNQYYFAQAWLVSERVGMQALKSGQEKATAKEMARLSYKPEMVALSMNR